MLTTKSSKQFVCLIIFVTLSLHPLTALAEDTYQFERMWPTLLQTWYFNDTEAVAIDGTGNIYVADTANHRIQKFTADGFLITTWGSQGNGNGQFNNPAGIAVDSSANVYVIDTDNLRIQKFTSDGLYLTQWAPINAAGTGVYLPRGIAVDSDGNVYISCSGPDYRNHCIQKFTADGSFIALWGIRGAGNLQFQDPSGIAIGTNGHLYIADSWNVRIQELTSNGDFIRTFNGNGALISPQGIASDSNGNIFVSDSLYVIHKFTSDGQYSTQLGTYGSDFADGQFHEPQGLAADASGNLFVADKGNNRIQKITSLGGFITKFSSSGSADGQLSYPFAVASDSSGNIYVADTLNNRIQKFTAGGQFIPPAWGKIDASGNPQSGTGNKEFYHPQGIAIDAGGHVYVADSGNSRIQKFTTEGIFVTQWGNSAPGNQQLLFPISISFDTAGNVFVADPFGQCIKKFDDQGNYILQWTGDLSNPSGIAVDIANTVYVADTSHNRVRIFDSNGSYITQFGGPGADDGLFNLPYGISVDSAGNIYVADTYNHRIQKFKPVDNGSGGYNYVFDGKWGTPGAAPGQMSQPYGLAMSGDNLFYVADTYNSRIQVFRKTTESFNSRAIIVAGGGPFEGNNLWDTTRMCANFAYRTLTYQGFNKNTIQYLSADIGLDLDGDSQPDVDADATNDNLQNAITSLANSGEEIGDVVLYLVDHGGVNTFRMGGSETLSSAELATRLNALQGKFTGKLIVIYDACESGTFRDVLAGDKRIIITSTAAGESAHFITQGSLSFSNLFWNQVLMGTDISSAFNLSSEAISFVTDFQTPQIMADPSIDLSATWIGNHTTNQGEGPQIASVSATLPPNSTAGLIHAEGVTDPDGIARVWAVIRPPDYRQGDTEKSILELPSVELTQTRDFGVYEGAWSGFTSLTTTSPGTYIISVYARDRVGNTSASPKLTSLSIETPRYRKAIIVAGGTEGEPLPPAIEKSVKQAWDALTFQGYTIDTIYLMSPFSIAGVAQIPVPPEKGNLAGAFTTWAQNQTQDLVVYLVGSGDTESFNTYTHEVTENGTTKTITETLTAQQLESWLDDLQAQIPGTVTVIYDAPKSASFLPLLIPPDGKQRINIASAGCTQEAFFLTEDNFSFSRFFWEQVLNGINVWDAFTQAGRGLFFLQAKHPASFSCMGQTPFLDDSGNGIGNESADGKLAKNHTIGIGIMRGADEPVIGEVTSQVSPPQTVNGEKFITITVQAQKIIATCDITGVWATIIPPDYCAAAGSEPPTIELLDDDNNKIWEGSYTYPVDPKVTVSGTFRVTAHVTDSCDKNALPKDTTVYQPIGPDIYEPDDVMGRASVIVLNDRTSQEHNFHDARDNDWVKFYGFAGQVYTIKAYDVGPLCDPVIDIFKLRTLQRLASVDISRAGQEEILEWPCTQDGFYFIRLRQSDAAVYGEGTQYYLKLYSDVGPIEGMIAGTTFDASTKKPISGVLIRTSSSRSATTDGMGGYFMKHPATPSFTLTAEKSGYQSFTESGLVLKQTETLWKDIDLVPGVTTCTMEKLFAGDAGQPILKRLRQIRDQKLARTLMGRTFIALYYASSNELNNIFESHPTLAAQAKKLITELLPEAEKTLGHDLRQMINNDKAAAVVKLLQDTQHYASPQLKRTVAFVSKKLVSR